MKGGLAAMVYAARDEGLLKSGRIGIVLVPDEETAGPRGSRDLAARGILGQGGIGMLTPEPTGGVVWNANRGAITELHLLFDLGKPSDRRQRTFKRVHTFELSADMGNLPEAPDSRRCPELALPLARGGEHGLRLLEPRPLAAQPKIRDSVRRGRRRSLRCQPHRTTNHARIGNRGVELEFTYRFLTQIERRTFARAPHVQPHTGPGRADSRQNPSKRAGVTMISVLANAPVRLA